MMSTRNRFGAAGACAAASTSIAAGAALLVAGVFSAQAAEDFPGVMELMSAQEFRDSGLEKLSSDEIRALDAWLVRYTAGEALTVKETSREVKEAEKNYAVESRLSGDFTGWDGKTVFRLENGQVWQQRLDGRYRYRGPANPQVRIERNWLGFHKMTLIEAERSIGVTRIR